MVKLQSFDALQRPSSIEVKNSAQQILVNRQYQYDLSGNITQIQSDSGKTEYGYDAISRLTKVRPDNALQALGLPEEQYSYDAVGNRLSSAYQPSTWNYNGDNQLVQYPRTIPFSMNPPVETQVSYTPQGHTQKESSSQGERSYGYNVAERLVEITQVGQSAQYRYDPMGRRIAKHVQQGSATHTIYFLYGEQGLLGEANAQGKLVTVYGFNPNAAQQGLWSTDPIWQANLATDPNPSLSASSTNYHYLHTDHLGTPMLATTKEGSSSWKAVAEAFGATGTLADKSAIVMNLRFPGQYFDEEVKGHYNFHRNYMPALGRYAQIDLLGLAAGVNVFVYGFDNPLVMIDALGLLSIENCDPVQAARIEAALQRVKQMLLEECEKPICDKNGCVPLQYCDQLKNMIDVLSISCAGVALDRNGNQDRNVCADAFLGTNKMRVYQHGLSGCRCLSLTIYHETFHNIGIGHVGESGGYSVNMGGHGDGDAVYQYEFACRKRLC